MAVVRDLGGAQLTFKIIGGDSDQFQVISYRGMEGLCRLFRFDLELVCDDPNLDLEKVVGTCGLLEIQTEFGERCFHGLISRFETTDIGPEGGFYHLELVPRLWLLTHRHQCRIFQNKSVSDIITDVFSDAGLPSDQIQKKLTGNHPAREYCVQYRETDYNFICRLMEEEGIWWYFEHSPEADKLVIADDPSAYAPIDGDPGLPFVPPSGMKPAGEHVFRFGLSHAVRPGVVTLQDFNFEKPDLKLESKGDLGRDKGLEYSDYPGQYTEQARGTELAKLRSEEFETGRVIAVGKSESIRLSPARTFELKEHPAESTNGSYVITSIVYKGKQATSFASAQAAGHTKLLDAVTSDSLLAARQDANEHTRNLANAVDQIASFVSRLMQSDPAAHRAITSWFYHGGKALGELAAVGALLQGSGLAGMGALGAMGHLGEMFGPLQPLYECQFECIPSTVSFRPPRLTPWPVMRGTQTARVVGPSGEEIYTDKYGRVKVQFPWDRKGAYDDKSSCWIRVAQGMAGGAYGILFLPHVGQEVIVDFLEGDPDKPLIVGRVYNADHMPPYALPDEKTKSVIKTSSTKGGGGTNEIRFEDLKDKEQLLINAQKDFHVRVKEEERHNVGKIQHLKVDDEQRIKIGKHRSVDVAGKDALHVTDTRNLTVDGDVIEDFKANHGHKVASQYYIKANQLVVEADSGISFKVGGNFVVIDSSGVSVKGTKIGLNSGGAALSKSANVSAASPAAPEDSDTVQPGKDKNYTGEPSQPSAVEEKKYEGHWVSIDLKDKEGNPAAGEYFEITKPNGTVVQGTLDVNGFARIWVEEPGQCQISFPLRDAEEWQNG